MSLMIEELKKLDIRTKKLGKMIAKNPNLLLKKPQEFYQVCWFFQKVLSCFNV